LEAQQEKRAAKEQAMKSKAKRMSFFGFGKKATETEVDPEEDYEDQEEVMIKSLSQSCSVLTCCGCINYLDTQCLITYLAVTVAVVLPLLCRSIRCR